MFWKFAASLVICLAAAAMLPTLAASCEFKEGCALKRVALVHPAAVARATGVEQVTMRKGMSNPQLLKALQAEYAEKCESRFPRLASGGTCSAACPGGDSTCGSACAYCQRLINRITKLKSQIEGR